jgi:hypothetical protein
MSGPMTRNACSLDRIMRSGFAEDVDTEERFVVDGLDIIQIEADSSLEILAGELVRGDEA